jgi:hypothetical protein
MSQEIWYYLIAYVVGTAFGMYVIFSTHGTLIENTISRTIDALIEQGFLKSTINENGDIELVKLSEHD